MKQDYTRIAVVLDRSGSMECACEATVAGFNEFMRQQREQPGEVSVWLVQFDDVVETVFDLPLEDATELTQASFVPRGSTALLDAQGGTIDALGRELAGLPEEQRPAKVIVLTLTDGQQNASKRYTTSQVAELVRQQREVYKWEFIYMGANQDAVQVASTMSIPAASSLTYSQHPTATLRAFSSAAMYSKRVRSGAAEQDLSFTEDDRVGAMKAQEDEVVAAP